METPALNTDPKNVAAQAAMMKLLSAKPEGIIAMLDRLGIPWDRIKTENGNYLFQMQWSDLVAAEQKLQNSETFMEKLAKEVEATHGADIRGLTQ